jgi:catechol 2,3-dioxygenase-like lactoylglutathione lyase family enzyme
MRHYRSFVALTLLSIAPVLAQLAPQNPAGVTMGSIHLAVKDVDAQKQFWVSMLGGIPVKDGTLDLIQFPGVFIVLHKAEPADPPAGSVLNHFGFVVKDMPGSLAKWKVANLKIEPTENPNEVYVNAPDGIRLEVYGVPSLPTAVQMNHIHFYTVDIPAMKAWYVKTFGATPGQRACVACVSKPRMIETGDLPGMNLSFAQADMPVAPTKGRSIDHIGFEVKNLDEFARKLQAQGVKFDVPVRQVPGAKNKNAFLTDPWGTYIELTEGPHAPHGN